MKEYSKQGGQEEPLGESLAWSCCESPPKEDAAGVVGMWKSEQENYVYGPVGSACTSKEDGEATGEYTQMVWAGTRKMGCGMASCGEKGTVWVCHFWPAGNVVGQTPSCASHVHDDMDMCPGATSAPSAESCSDSDGSGHQTHQEAAKAAPSHAAAPSTRAVDGASSSHASDTHVNVHHGQKVTAIIEVEGYVHKLHLCSVPLSPAVSRV